MSSAVEVQQLVKRYGRVTAVDGVTLSVNSGEIVGYLGPNGAGRRRPFAACWVCSARPAVRYDCWVSGCPTACLACWTTWDTFLGRSDCGRS